MKMVSPLVVAGQDRRRSLLNLLSLEAVAVANVHVAITMTLHRPATTACTISTGENDAKIASNRAAGA
jgi:hypothetical protein